jgi:DNA-directed RNA polymerase subunit RPC12/RpoP
MEGQLREVSCICGHSYESDLKVNWCPKCGQKIFETEKERKAHKINGLYMYAVIGLSISALAFFFFKLIIIPVLSM